MITLERFAYTPEMGTFGKLTFRDFTCYTLEPSWRGNAPGISCIPEGVYSASRYNSPSRGPVWQLNQVPGRSYIQIHPANIADELEGCIALGSDLGYVRWEWAVLNSQRTFAEFMRITPELDELTINIIPYTARWP